MAEFTIALDDSAAREKLARIAAAGRSPNAMRGVALAAKQQVYNAFRLQQGPDGHAWPALAAATLKARARKGHHGLQPLIDTGKMYESIAESNTDTTATVSIGEKLPDARAWYNQHGTLRAPARPMLPISGDAVTPAWWQAIRAPIIAEFEKAAA